MYCGCNNNLSEDELNELKEINANNIHTQNKQESTLTKMKHFVISIYYLISYDL